MKTRADRSSTRVLAALVSWPSSAGGEADELAVVDLADEVGQLAGHQSRRR